MKTLLVLLLFVSATDFAPAQSLIPKLKKKKITYEFVEFEDLLKRYLRKTPFGIDPIEGIYSVSCVVTRKQPSFFFNIERTKVLDRQDNFARVAIIKEWSGENRDYMEISLSYREANKYPVVGEVNMLSEGRGYIYKHLEPDGKSMSFSMTLDTDLLEGEYVMVNGRKSITYRISYLKIYPKTSEFVVDQF